MYRLACLDVPQEKATLDQQSMTMGFTSDLYDPNTIDLSAIRARSLYYQREVAIADEIEESRYYWLLLMVVGCCRYCLSAPGSIRVRSWRR